MVERSTQEMKRSDGGAESGAERDGGGTAKETVAQLFVRCLEEEGVTMIFGVPGEENEDFLFALEDSSIRFIPTRHEQGAAFIADVWGRLTGTAGVCLATLGPGATNLLTGIADAYLDKAPVVAITAQGSLDRLHHESHQRLDIVSLFRPITKWNASIGSPRIVTEVVRKAFKVAQEEKPGAVHIELPEDVAAEAAPAGSAPLAASVVRRPSPDEDALDEAVKALRAARRPLILAGNGAVRTRASQELCRLAEGLGIPVAHTFMGKGALPDTSPQSLLALGLGFRDYVMEAVDRSDLVLAVGYDVAEVAPKSWNPEGSKPIVHLDFEPAEVYERYHPKTEVVADLAESLRRLHDRLRDEGAQYEEGWYENVRRRILDDLASYRLEDGEPFTVPGVLQVLRSLMADGDLLISDVGSHKIWIARNFPTHCPGGCIISNGLASMGIALPGAIAASLADPERQVVAAMGDGGFLMNSQELETARRVGAAFTAIVFRDEDYGLIRWKQEMERGASTGTVIGNPDLVAYAESFGIRAYRPENPAQLGEQLGEALASREVCLMDVPISTAVNGELTRKLERYWKEGT